MALRDSSCSKGLHGPDRQALDASNCRVLWIAGNRPKRTPVASAAVKSNTRPFSEKLVARAAVCHVPTKPKSHRATMEHNLEWFDQYMFHSTPKPTSTGSK
jgi:hypothetical protein